MKLGILVTTAVLLSSSIAAAPASAAPHRAAVLVSGQGLTLEALLPTKQLLSRRDFESVRRIAVRMERNANYFRQSLDAALDSGRLNGSGREDRINLVVRDFEQSTNRLRSRLAQRLPIDLELQEVISRGERIDGFMRRQRLGLEAEQDWALLRQDLRDLASIADYRARF